MSAYKAKRDIPYLGMMDVLEVKLTPEESQRIHSIPDLARRERLQSLGMKLSGNYYWTNDSEGNVYYYEVL